MTTETMTIHKALMELKLLDSRISKEIRSGTYVTGKKNSDKFINGIPTDEVVKNIRSHYAKVTDLIKRRKALKKAVVLSNAKTEVEIAGVTCTVAEAIEMKNHGVEFDKDVVNTLNSRYTDVSMCAATINGEALEKRADQYITSLYGQKDGKNISTEVEDARRKFIESNTYEIIDPLKVQDVAAGLEDYINAFMAEVDSALSVSNALTEITIEY